MHIHRGASAALRRRRDARRTRARAISATVAVTIARAGHSAARQSLHAAAGATAHATPRSGRADHAWSRRPRSASADRARCHARTTSTTASLAHGHLKTFHRWPHSLGKGTTPDDGTAQKLWDFRRNPSDAPDLQPSRRGTRVPRLLASQKTSPRASRRTMNSAARERDAAVPRRGASLSGRGRTALRRSPAQKCRTAKGRRSEANSRPTPTEFVRDFCGVPSPKSCPKLARWYERFSKRPNLPRCVYPSALLTLAYGLPEQSGVEL
jgi:hypothetical protein